MIARKPVEPSRSSRRKLHSVSSQRQPKIIIRIGSDPNQHCGNRQNIANAGCESFCCVWFSTDFTAHHVRAIAVLQEHPTIDRQLKDPGRRQASHRASGGASRSECMQLNPWRLVACLLLGLRLAIPDLGEPRKVKYPLTAYCSDS